MAKLLKTDFPVLIFGRRAERIRLYLVGSIFWESLKYYYNPVKAFKELRRLQKLRQSAHGNTRISKFIKSGKRYHWVTDYPGFPSGNFRQLIRSEFHRNVAENTKKLKESLSLQTILWSLTNRCPLKCDHCSEWNNRDVRDHLKSEELQEILTKIEQQGIRHIQLGGGEPLLRFSDLTSLLSNTSEHIDFWLLTSGFGLTAEKANALKKAGLIGVQISLDHWDETKHNKFRNHPESYEWVMKAVQNCCSAGLIVSLSLCATPEFTNVENLEAYASLAKFVGAHFIRILEPAQAGRLLGKNVNLSDQQVEILSAFTIRLNSDPAYRDFPIATFFGYHQRELGCFGAGNRYLYIDPDGNFHACPFCRGNTGNALNDSFNDVIKKLKEKGCNVFRTVR